MIYTFCIDEEAYDGYGLPFGVVKSNGNPLPLFRIIVSAFRTVGRWAGIHLWSVVIVVVTPNSETRSRTDSLNGQLYGLGVTRLATDCSI